MGERGFGGIFGNVFTGSGAILFFIILFLLLFWDGFGFGGVDPK